MQMGGNGLMLEGEHYFHKTDNPGRRLQVTNVRLDRPEDTRSSLRAWLADYCSQGLYFNGIS